MPPIVRPAECATLVKPTRDRFGLLPARPEGRSRFKQVIPPSYRPPTQLRRLFVFASKEAVQAGLIYTVNTFTILLVQACAFLESSSLFSYCVVNTLHSRLYRLCVSCSPSFPPPHLVLCAS